MHGSSIKAAAAQRSSTGVAKLPHSVLSAPTPTPLLRAPVQTPQVRCAASSNSDAAASSDPPLRQAIAGLVRGIYKASAQLQPADPSLSPLWGAVKRLDAAGVASAIRGGASPDERDPSSGDTPLLFIARAGHYKYPPAEIPLALVQAGADLEAKDRQGRTAVEVALLSGWQNIAELLIKSDASTKGVGAIKGSVTCPDCKRIIASYNL